MSPPAKAQSERDAQVLGALIAALTPLLAWLACVSPYGPATGGDGLLSAALALQPAAAPGHLLAVLLARLCTLLPLGPLPLRVALAMGLCNAAAAAALYRALDTSLRAQGLSRAVLASPLALGATLLAFGLPQLFDSRPHAHAVALALGCLWLERLCAALARWPRRAPAALRAAVFWWALLLVEQPPLALLLLLACAPVLQRLLRVQLRAAAALWPLAAAVPAALLPWLLARRAHAALAPELRLPLSAWRGAAGWNAGARAADAPAVLLGLALLAGLLLVLLRPGARRLHGTWLAIAAASLLGSRLLQQPGAAPALAGCAALALLAAAFGALLQTRESSALALVLSVLSVPLGLAGLHAATLRARAQPGAGADLLREALLRALPPRSVVLVETDLALALRDARAEEQVRPDCVLARKPWALALPGAEALAAVQPELRPLLRAHLLQGGVPLTELKALASRRSVLVELDPAHEPGASAALLPFGPYAQVATSPPLKSDVRVAAAEAWQRWDRLLHAFDPAGLDPGASALVRARLLASAAYYDAAGDPEDAARARARVPGGVTGAASAPDPRP